MLRVIGAPTDLGGCLLWLDAQDSATVIRNGSNQVSQWSDKSGNANHATQGTDANKPVYSATGYGGLPCVDWTPSGVVTAARSLATPSVSLSAYTVFAVCRGDTSNGYLWTHVTDSATGSYIFGRNHSGRVIRAGGTSAKTVGPTATSTWLADGVRKLAVVTFGGTHASHLFSLGGERQGTIDSQLPAADPGLGVATGAMYIGNNQTPASTWRGVIAEMIVFNRQLTLAEIVLVEQYLSRKWAVGVQMSRLIGSPLDISDCAMWFDAGQGITQSGGLISQWDDQSGNARHVAQSNNSFKPTYNANNALFGGRPTTDWAAGTSQRLERLAADNFAQPLTIFACASLGASNTLLKALFNNASGAEHTIVIRDTVANGWQWYSAGPFANFPYPDVGTKPFVLSAAAGGVGIRLAVNGVVLVNAGTTFSGSVMTTLRVGGNVDGGTVNRNWFGSIAEFIVYRRHLLDGELRAGEAYLKRKYAL